MWDDLDGGTSTRLTWRGEELGEIRHTEIAAWDLSGTASPDGRTIAVTASTLPLRPSRSLAEILDGPSSERQRASTLALIDAKTLAVSICSGRFDNFGVPAWSAHGATVVVGTPFEPKHLYVADVGERALTPVAFKHEVPTPLLDASLLPTT